MNYAVVNALHCPVCRRGLKSETARLVCEQGHSFDISRQGYVNLVQGRPHFRIR
jgi:23S rRNA (guanine745-N1)-methyltransferase